MGDIMKIIKSNPKNDGYRMPGEFEKHSGCLMLWPYRCDNWRNNAFNAQQVFIEVAMAISKYETVLMGIPSFHYKSALKLLPSNIKTFIIESDDAWMRDVGPTFVVNNNSVRAVDWRFNAWGGEIDGLYENYSNDDLVASKTCEFLGVDYYFLSDFILEGGSIHVDGEGCCIVTEECLLHKSRNPHLNKAQIEKILENYLNVTKIIWVPFGIYNDETNGHVDNIIHYCKPGEVFLAWTDDLTDPQYKRSKACYDILSTSVDSKNRKFKIHKLHIPSPIKITKKESSGIKKVKTTLARNEGDRQAASYTNFYIANNAVIVPLFNDEKFDSLALTKIKEVFPNHCVEGIYSREILLGGGNIHCITQQIPKGVIEHEK